MADVAFNHVGHCVADLARAKRFYQEALGFELLYEVQPPDDSSSTLMRLPNPGLTATYLRRDGLILELLHFAAAGTTPVRDRPMNEPGLTHISVSVTDIDKACARVVERGGEVVEETRIPDVAVFVRDPDGQLIELLPMSYRERLAAQGF